jgi:hypothetical protein
MVKSFSIVIDEVDDAEIALGQLKAQMSGIKLLKNSVGLASVHPEFISSDVYSAIAKAVPFSLVGMTTISQTADGKTGTFLFSILVLTSDTCQFAHGTSDEIPQQGGDTALLSQKCYNSLRSKLEGEAKLAILYFPFMEQQSIHKYIEAISETNKHVPIFGSISNADMKTILDDQKTVYCENNFDNRFILLLISGDISPEFYIGSVTRESIIMPNIGEITAAKDHLVTEINNENICSFFEKIGFSTGDIRSQGVLTSVFIIDEKDKDGNIISSASRSLIMLDNGIGVFGGHIKIGSILSLAAVTKDVVMTTAKEVVDKVKEKHKNKTILMFSCVGRCYSLLDEPKKEYELLNEEFKSSGSHYLASCSCGEICPTTVSETTVLNGEHNQSLVACVF